MYLSVPEGVYLDPSQTGRISRKNSGQGSDYAHGFEGIIFCEFCEFWSML